MTVNLLRGKKGDATAPDPKPAAMPIAIGEMDAHVFNCTTCGRPLADGTWSCPSCGTKYVLGVTAKRASVLLALGLVVGVVVGGVVAASAITVSAPAKPVEAAVVATPAPVATALPSAVAVPVGPPQAAVSALTLTARQWPDGPMRPAGRDRRPHGDPDVARGLRLLSADARQGTDLVARLAPWHEAGVARGHLDDFYRRMSDTATLALRGSLNDASGYRSSATDMLGVLSRLSAVDAESRTLADTIDLELPPVDLRATP
jgi:hypothetical protein